MRRSNFVVATDAAYATRIHICAAFTRMWEDSRFAARSLLSIFVGLTTEVTVCTLDTLQSASP